MATVGNLFVNIRGRTKGLKQDLGKAKGMMVRGRNQMNLGGFSIEKQAMEARKEYAKALETARQAAIAFNPARKMGGKIEQAGRQGLADARSNLSAAKEKMRGAETARTRAIVATTLGVLGMTVGLFKMLYSSQRKQMQAGQQNVDPFKFAGPQGSKIAQIEAGKIRARLAAAQDPATSMSYLEKAKSELALEQTQNQRVMMGNFFDIISNYLQREINLLFSSGGNANTYGLTKAKQQAQMTGLTGQAP